MLYNYIILVYNNTTILYWFIIMESFENYIRRKIKEENPLLFAILELVEETTVQFYLLFVIWRDFFGGEN